MTTSLSSVGRGTIRGIACAGAVLALLSTGTSADQAIDRGDDDLAGVVRSPHGPEAGVWVIAETSDLGTKFVRIVVTDDAGRYLMPGLPKATYRVWVRGYGLVDSAAVTSTPGRTLNLDAVPAPDARAAAAYYPAGYWFSMLHVPPARDFPGKSAKRLSPEVKSQAEWLRNLKSGGCLACHQLGSRGTRTIPAALGTFPTSVAAWQRRLQSGQSGMNMITAISHLGPRALTLFADWTDWINAGELPPA